MADEEEGGSPAGPRGYELNYFARKYALTRDEALDLFESCGNDRDRLDAAAEAFNRARSAAGGDSESRPAPATPPNRA